MLHPNVFRHDALIPDDLSPHTLVVIKLLVLKG